MPDKEHADNLHPESRVADNWRAVLAAIDDRILRVCLPRSPERITLDKDQITIAVDSEFKKEYCLRKLPKIEETVAKVIGPRCVVIGEPPLVESARQTQPHAGISAHIAVLGIGDGGINAINRMHEENLQGVKLIAVDTDKQILGISRVHDTLQIGLDITGGRGTGGDVARGQKAATESHWEIANLLEDIDLVFVTAGLGGGTGTGAAPVIAEIAKKSHALTISVVTKPFSFEGVVRAERAKDGLARLAEATDVSITISNDRLLETAAKGIAMTKAFELADQILFRGVQGISDLITIRGLVNLDFADIRNVLINAGTAMMGTGKARGDQRAMAAAKLASTNPLLEGGSIRGARKMIMNVTGGQDLTLQEVTQAADVIRKIAAVECDLVFGAVIRENLGNQIQITVIAADFQETLEKGQLSERRFRRERITEDTDLSIPAFVRRRRDTEGKPNSAD